MSISEVINQLYEEREKFIIVGLTGRTGSGCSEVADLLCNDFETLSLLKPTVIENNEHRKNNIIYRYAEKHWYKFTKIKMKNIITTVLLEHNLRDFTNAVTNKLEAKEIEKDKISLIINELNEIIEAPFKECTQLKESITAEFDQGDKSRLDDLYELYFIKIPELTKKIKEIITRENKTFFGKLYSYFANNIRKTGNPYGGSFEASNIFMLSKKTNKLIKILRRYSEKKNKKVLVVIDSLRNPFEVTYFRNRYSAFYLFSINTDENIREERLKERGFTVEEIEDLKKLEDPEMQNKEDNFSNQNIGKCIELTDVYLYSSKDKDYLKRQLVKYIMLIIHPGLVTPTHEESCMQVAFNAKLNSGCLSRQVGAVVTDDNFAIKSVGWNQTPEGQVPCNLRNLNSLIEQHTQERNSFSNYEWDQEDFREYVKDQIGEKTTDQKLRGRQISYCFKDAYNGFTNSNNQVHTRSLHAEENAFLQISKYGGQGIQNGYLFTTASPCELCSKKSFHLGIKTIYYVDPYPGISVQHILGYNTNSPELRLFEGALGRTYDQLYTPIMPYKDEIYMLLDYKFNKRESSI
ncbi:hypothetical protein ACTL7R_00360 [Priestia aryabhattai]|uniref:hypothetical protein n=1 Tax=Priestia TaxID=2800373 RepID=UPI003F8B60E3